LGISVLHVVSELYPFVKTGGLGDIASALPATLRDVGIDARVIVPGYPGVLSAITSARTIREDGDLFRGGPARLLAATLRGTDVPAFVLDCPGLYGRDGGPYQDKSGHDYPDNARRFAALGLVAFELASGAHPVFVPDVLHGHDWQSGLSIAYTKLRAGAGPSCVITIHNIDYPGAFDASLVPELALPPEAFSIHGLEFFGRLSFLKAAIYYADRITTVSPTYARELQRDGHGGGFEGLLRGRSSALSGILNGVDYTEWDPAADRHLPAHYGPEDPSSKKDAKALLQRRFGLEVSPGPPVFGLVSRLVHQKGIDWVVGAIPFLVERGAQFVCIGSGDPAFADALGELAKRHPKQVGFLLGYDEDLAHLVQAGSDSMVVPSRSEPCGLTQMYALRYGSPPVVRCTGGLADTVVDATRETIRAGTATGFWFEEASTDGFRDALDRAMTTYRDKAAWKRLMATGMRTDFGWRGPAQQYRALYEDIRRERGR